MAGLKELFLEFDDIDDDQNDDSVEVYADSVKQAIQLASHELNADVSMLDYEIIRKGTKGFLGFGRQPYRVVVRKASINSDHQDLDELEARLSAHVPGVVLEEKKHQDGTFKIRVTRSGIWLTVTTPKGKGRPVEPSIVNTRLYAMRISNADTALIEKTVKNASGEPAKIGDWTPNPDFDSRLKIEISEDEMKAYLHFTPPRYYGRNLDLEEVMSALKLSGVVFGINEEKLKEYLENMDYSYPLLGAEGQRPKNGRDAKIDYKVRINKANIKFEEDESGKVDFRNLELLENVVVGQVLAVKIPPEKGTPGRTVTNKVIPVKPGRDISIQFGKGTILSQDKTELTAEINGQVVFKRNRISVEPVYIISGDVGLETGNVNFLGSVIVSGNVLDNFVVKAAGNIEVKGTVQKAFIEAEGDIIVHQGISGRDEAIVESTGGSVYAKFIQNAKVISENNVIVPEGVLHANVDAGESIISIGRRARIVGGLIRAGSDVNARFLGADVATKTSIFVGVNPKVLQQISELEKSKAEIVAELEDVKKNITTLANQKKVSKLSAEKEALLQDLENRSEKGNLRIEEIKTELEELETYIAMLDQKGKVCAEKKIFPGVDINIRNQKFVVKDEYNYIKFSLEGDDIRLSEYEPPKLGEGQRISTLVSRRR